MAVFFGRGLESDGGDLDAWTFLAWALLALIAPGGGSGGDAICGRSGGSAARLLVMRCSSAAF
jgi:hypothetical protein